jgi:phosphohistidine phosphatase
MTARDTELLLLVRHGTAEDRHPDGDTGRRLTSAGADAFRASAAAVAERAAIRSVVCSPYARARQTADLLAEAMGGVSVDLQPELGVGVTGASVAAMAEALGPGTALVGHNPSMTEAAAVLLGRDERLVRFPAGTTAALARAASGWELRWVARPGEPIAQDF